MTLDDVIRYNEKLLAELEARRDVARAAEVLHRTENEKSAPKVEHSEVKATPPEHDAPQTYQTQTYEITAPNEVVVTQEARLPESPQDIQALIDIVKKHLEILQQGKEWNEIDKEALSNLALECKETQENNKDTKSEVQALMTTPDHPEAQWVSDAHSHPQQDPITALFLMSGLAVGLVSDIMGGKGIVETAKEGVEKSKEALENTLEKAKDMVRDALNDPVLAAKEKEQAAAREKLDADLKKQMELQEKRWDQQGKGDDEKAALMQKAEKAAQAIIDKMIADQAKELERMRRMEEAHRPRW